MLLVSLIYAYIPSAVKHYQALFFLLQISVVGRLISFPIQVYATISLTFSTLHIFLSYGFVYRFLKDIRQDRQLTARYNLSLSIVRWSLLFMVLSPLGPYALEVVMSKGLAGTPVYRLAIYFYLQSSTTDVFPLLFSGCFSGGRKTNLSSLTRIKPGTFFG